MQTRRPITALVFVAIAMLAAGCAGSAVNPRQNASGPAAFAEPTATAVPELADDRIEVCAFDLQYGAPVHGVVMVGADVESGIDGEPVFVAMNGVGRETSLASDLDPSAGVATTATVCIDGTGRAGEVSCGEYLREDQNYGGSVLWVSGSRVDASWFAADATEPVTTTSLDMYGSCPDEYTTTTTTYGSITLGDDDPLNDTRSSQVDADDVRAVAEHMAMRAEVVADTSPLAALACTALANVGDAQRQLGTWHAEIAADSEFSSFSRFDPPSDAVVGAGDKLAEILGDWSEALPDDDDETLFTPVLFAWVTTIFDFPTVLTFVDPISEATDEEAGLMLLGLSGRHGLFMTESESYPYLADQIAMIGEASRNRCS